VLCRSRTRSRLPGGTVEGCQFCQGSPEHVEGRVLVPIQHHPTLRADVRSLREGVLDTNPTAAAILRRQARGNRTHGSVDTLPILAHPGEEQPPTGITDAFGQMRLLDHPGYFQVFVGKEARET
jgi:hypothetical protein